MQDKASFTEQQIEDTIPAVIDSAIADFAQAVREHAPDSRERRAALRVLRGQITAALSMAREEGGRIALGFAELDES